MCHATWLPERPSTQKLVPRSDGSQGSQYNLIKAYTLNGISIPFFDPRETHFSRGLVFPRQLGLGGALRL